MRFPYWVTFLAPLVGAALASGCFLDKRGLGPEFSTAEEEAGSDASVLGADAALEAGSSSSDAAADSASDASAPPDGEAPSDATVDAAVDAPIVTPGADGSADASFDSPSDANAADVVAMPEGGGIPVGWELVLLANASANPPLCPDGFGTHDVFGAFQASPAACSCSCTMTAQPDCTTGTLDTRFGADRGCRQSGASFDVSDGGCLSVNASLRGRFFEGTPVPPQGGACASSAVADPTKVTKSPVRYCSEPPATAPTGAAPAPAGFVACITAPGQQACPAGSGFVRQELVEDDVAVTCSTCAACTFVATCTNASLSVFDGRGCTSDSLVVALPVDGTCQETGVGASAVSSVSYTAQASATCSVRGASMPTLQPTNTRTVCCP